MLLPRVHRRRARRVLLLLLLAHLPATVLRILLPEPEPKRVFRRHELAVRVEEETTAVLRAVGIRRPAVPAAAAAATRRRAGLSGARRRGGRGVQGRVQCRVGAEDIHVRTPTRARAQRDAHAEPESEPVSLLLLCVVLVNVGWVRVLALRRVELGLL